MVKFSYKLLERMFFHEIENLHFTIFDVNDTKFDISQGNSRHPTTFDFKC